ncbi:hypothetical protein DITRI_Ditri03aG0149400 [Diplodiscus trichospermus]
MTLTLLGTISGFSPISRCSDRLSKFGTEMISYKDGVDELMSSLENMNFYEVSSPMAGGTTTANFPWIDVSFNGEDQQ